MVKEHLQGEERLIVVLYSIVEVFSCGVDVSILLFNVWNQKTSPVGLSRVVIDYFSLSCSPQFLINLISNLRL